MNGGQREARGIFRAGGNNRGGGGIGESFDGFSVIDEGHSPRAAWEGSIPGAVL
jgi:hypothetical protein